MDVKSLLGARILLTGHTGFKGYWLSRILLKLGVQVSGISLPPEKGSLFEKFGDQYFEMSEFHDIRDFEAIKKVINRIRPDAVIHMAAQPLVLRSYREPLSTFQTNVLGTANLLDISRGLECIRAVVVVTSDKVYKNLETGQAYVEEDSLGGKDPYSASKSATEMVVRAWQNLWQLDSKQVVVSARAGNIIGGGDHSENRLMPDLVRSFKSGTPAILRNPDAVRPWQHVIDPLFGYIALVSALLKNQRTSNSYNFGPSIDSRYTVRQLADFACREWGSGASWVHRKSNEELQESKLLCLDSSQASRELDWKVKLDAHNAVRWTIEWERANLKNNSISIIDDQINNFLDLT
jgi:CDP-glucose 4,6-dehydratase